MFSPTTKAEQVCWPGVVVVGGGVTGLLTALELDRQGVQTLVLEQGSLCSGQTGQCHGWLHRGAVFADAEPEELRLLDRGAERWKDLAGAVSGWGCALGGQQEDTRRAVAAVWDHLARPYISTTQPHAGCAWTLAGPETAVVPVDVLKEAVSASGVALRGGRVTALQPGPDRRVARAVSVQAEGRSVSIAADGFVLAGGAGLPELVPDLALTRRLSFMLVVSGFDLPESGLAVPEQDALGLFVVPRRKVGSRVLLISNFVSYAPDTDVRYSEANWLAGIAPTVLSHLPQVWSDTTARWGIYPAVKAEPARDLVLGVTGPAVWSTQYGNVWAGVPGKLVLAPVLAERLATKLLNGPQRRDSGAATDWRELLSSLPAVPWGPEEWEVTPLVRRETLFSG